MPSIPTRRPHQKKITLIPPNVPCLATDKPVVVSAAAPVVLPLVSPLGIFVASKACFEVVIRDRLEPYQVRRVLFAALLTENGWGYDAAHISHVRDVPTGTIWRLAKNSTIRPVNGFRSNDTGGDFKPPSPPIPAGDQSSEARR